MLKHFIGRLRKGMVPVAAVAVMLGCGACPASAAGSVAAWGDNSAGQLGNNSTSSTNVPADVLMSGALAGKTVSQVAAGARHSLALTSDGKVYSWGDNDAGQLGNNSHTPSSVPVAVDATGVLEGRTVIAISAGRSHSVALTSEGRIVSWGDNSSGQLGDNSTTSSSVPVSLALTGAVGRRTFIAIAAGGQHSVAIANDGRLFAWGDNTHGQLGDGSFTGSAAAVAVSIDGTLAGKTVTAIAAGATHNLALSSEGFVFSWGRNNEGQLGDGSNNNSNVPVAVSTANNVISPGVIAISAGGNHSLALTRNHDAVTWGANYWGQLGHSLLSSSNVPVRVTTNVIGSSAVRKIAAGFDHNLIYASGGKIYGWGLNMAGQLGNGNNAIVNYPVASTMSGALSGKAIEMLSAGPGHSLAIASVPVAVPGTEQLVLSVTGEASANFGQYFEQPLDSGGKAVFRSVTSSPARFDGQIRTGFALKPDTTDPSVKYESGTEDGKYWYQYTVIGAGAGLAYFGTTLENGSPQGTITQSLVVTNELHLEGSASETNYPQGGSPVLRAVLTENGASLTGASITARFSDSEIAALPLYDDGAHGDGAAGDGVYGATVPPITKKGSFVATLFASGINAAGEEFGRQADVTFTIGADTVPPEVAVTSPANNSTRR